MSEDSLRSTIDDAWEERETISPATGGALRDAIEAALDALDSGSLRVAEKVDGSWQVNQWLKKAVLLSFRLYDMAHDRRVDPTIRIAATTPWFDKVPSKFDAWDEARVSRRRLSRRAKLRRPPFRLCRARRRADADRSSISAPMWIATPWSTPGLPSVQLRTDRASNCHHLRRRRHRRGAGTAAGQPGDHRGRLLHRRPLGSSRGRDRRTSVLGAVHGRLSSAARPRSSTATTGEVHYGRVPAYSVVVPGSPCPGGRWPDGNRPGPSLYCAP